MGSRRRCCCGGCVVTFCVVCGATPEVGATVTVKDGGGSTVATGVTDGTGCVDLDVGTAGTYTVQTSGAVDGFGDPYQDTERSLTLACGDTKALEVCGPCSNCPLPASNLTLTFKNTGAGSTAVTLTYHAGSPYPNWSFLSAQRIYNLHCVLGQGWSLAMTYNDTVFGGTASCTALLSGSCDPANLTVVSPGGIDNTCVNFEASTGLKLPITVTL